LPGAAARQYCADGDADVPRVADGFGADRQFYFEWE